MATPDYVTVESAGHLTGIPARTLRRWVADGKLPATRAGRTNLVAVADVGRVAAMAGRPVDASVVADGFAGHAATAMAGRDSLPEFGNESNGHAPAISPAARSQLEAIRDEWLRPLIDELNAKSEEIGRLKRDLEHLRAENDALRANGEAPTRVETAREARDGSAQGLHAPDGNAALRPPQRAWWAFWRRGR